MKLLRTLLIVLLCCGGAIAQEITPSTTSDSLPEQVLPEEPQEVELKGDWRESVDGRLHLRREEDNSAVKQVNLKLQYRGQDWLTRFQSEGGLDSENRTMRLYTEKQLWKSAQGFTEWESSAQAETLKAGFQYSLFGRDEWRLSRKFDPFSEGTQGPEETEMSVGWRFNDAHSLRFLGCQSHLKTEVGAGLVRSNTDGLQWGATVKATRLENNTGYFNWNQPSVEGNLRWTW